MRITPEVLPLLPNGRFYDWSTDENTGFQVPFLVSYFCEEDGWFASFACTSLYEAVNEVKNHLKTSPGQDWTIDHDVMVDSNLFNYYTKVVEWDWRTRLFKVLETA